MEHAYEHVPYYRENAKFSERLGAPTHTEVEFVDALPRTARGKVRTVIAS